MIMIVYDRKPQVKRSLLMKVLTLLVAMMMNDDGTQHPVEMGGLPLCSD